MSYIKLNYITPQQAAELYDFFTKNIGFPTEDRVLIVTPNKEDAKYGAIIIPDSAKEALPKKGVIIGMGHISEAYRNSMRNVEVGHVVTYGLYAGKELEFDETIFPDSLQNILKTNTFTVLSINEILFVERNNSK